MLTEQHKMKQKNTFVFPTQYSDQGNKFVNLIVIEDNSQVRFLLENHVHSVLRQRGRFACGLLASMP